MRETRLKCDTDEITVLVCPTEAHLEIFSGRFSIVARSFAEGVLALGELFVGSGDDHFIGAINAVLLAQRDLVEFLDDLAEEIDFLQEMESEDPDVWEPRLATSLDDEHAYAVFRPIPPARVLAVAADASARDDLDGDAMFDPDFFDTTTDEEE